MTPQETLLATAREELGYTSGDNSENKYGKWYGLNNQPYSAMFISWCFAKYGLSSAVNATTEKGFSSPKSGYEWFKNNNRLVEKAKPGDIVFLAFNSLHPNHVGIVEKILYTKFKGFKVPCAIKTIEANVCKPLGRADGVFTRVRHLGEDTHIIGIARPEWEPKPLSQP